MTLNNQHLPVLFGLSFSALSSAALLVNSFFYQYRGNNYFPPEMAHSAIALPLILVGTSIQFGKTNLYSKLAKEVIYYFMIVVIMAFATNAAQYTPFQPIDAQIISFEKTLGISVQNIMAWAAHRPLLQQILSYAYNSLSYQLIILPLFVIAMRKFDYLREYYCLLLLTALLGFGFYYFFPTMAPASLIDSPFFSPEQHDTALKFKEIHHHMEPSTIAGGLIALPSFHVIWACLCLYLIREWRFIFFPLAILNGLLCASCVLLGWHYPTDIAGAFIIIFIANYLYKCFGGRLKYQTVSLKNIFRK